MQGGARIPARLSRIGVQNYTQADGKVIREYRPPEEVFDAKSLKSFETATVTVGHPDMVRPETWKDHAIGFPLTPHVEDGRFVGADIVLQDAEAIRRASLPATDPDALVELSCGYDCNLEMKPGVSPDGEKYDAIQRDIVVNHIGLGPKDWGRAGSAVKLKLDGGAVSHFEANEPRANVAMSTEAILGALRGGWVPRP